MISGYKTMRCVCAWRGNGEGCRQPTIYGFAYCESHYNIMYTTVSEKMAEAIIEEELSSIG
jgi:hypothetical protein